MRIANATLAALLGLAACATHETVTMSQAPSYGDVESGDYQNAWQLLDSGMTTGQTYQEFVDGFNCTTARSSPPTSARTTNRPEARTASRPGHATR
jgi:hypothetical protein